MRMHKVLGSEFGVLDLGWFRVEDLGFRVEGWSLGCGIWVVRHSKSVGCRISGFRFWLLDLECRV